MMASLNTKSAELTKETKVNEESEPNEDICSEQSDLEHDGSTSEYEMPTSGSDDDESLDADDSNDDDEEEDKEVELEEETDSNWESDGDFEYNTPGSETNDEESLDVDTPPRFLDLPEAHFTSDGRNEKTALNSKSHQFDLDETQKKMNGMIGVKLEVPVVSSKTSNPLRGTKTLSGTIINADVSTADNADPCFEFERDKPDGGGPYTNRHSDVLGFRTTSKVVQLSEIGVEADLARDNEQDQCSGFKFKCESDSMRERNLNLKGINGLAEEEGST